MIDAEVGADKGRTFPRRPNRFFVSPSQTPEEHPRSELYGGRRLQQMDGRRLGPASGVVGFWADQKLPNTKKFLPLKMQFDGFDEPCTTADGTEEHWPCALDPT